MTRRALLLDLAAQCEAALGVDARLDCEIENALGLAKWKRDPRIGYGDAEYYREPIKAFTGLLDAAMTLVPEKLRWCVDTCGGKPHSFVEDLEDFSDNPLCCKASAATPPLALTAAALKALAAQIGESE